MIAPARCPIVIVLWHITEFDYMLNLLIGCSSLTLLLLLLFADDVEDQWGIFEGKGKQTPNGPPPPAAAEDPYTYMYNTPDTHNAEGKQQQQQQEGKRVRKTATQQPEQQQQQEEEVVVVPVGPWETAEAKRAIKTLENMGARVSAWVL